MKEQELLRCWNQNAQGWSEAIRTGAVKSRAATDRAILEAVGEGQGLSLLDLGCGEGSLSRRFSAAGWRVTGVDAVEELLATARSSGSERYLQATYAELGECLDGRTFDGIVANFSLLGEESTRTALVACCDLLKPGGRLWIQTLHPKSMGASPPGWRTETWTSLGELACHPSPWYARDLEGWRALFPIELWSLREQSVQGQDGQPLSLILCARRL